VFRNRKSQTKMKKLKKDQRGFTLIELLIAILLTGLITGGITMTIFQVFNLNTRTSNHMTAVRQVQNAGFWVSPDVQMAKNVTTGGSPGVLLTLTWTAPGTGDAHKVIYTLEDMPSGEFKRLWRSHSVNDEEPTVTHVAEYIDIDPTETYCCCDCDGDGDCDDNCNCDAKVVIFKVTANVGGQSETREYEVKPRPGS